MTTPSTADTLPPPTSLNPPYGGTLVDPLVGAARAADLRAASRDWPSWTLTPRQLCELELLLNGSFSPLTGFLGRADHEAVCAHMRLSDGTLWPLPVTLDVPAHLAASWSPGSTLALRDSEGVMLAALDLEEMWEPDLLGSACAVLGTSDASHPGIAQLTAAPVAFVAGRLEGLQLPVHYDFRSLRLTPTALRAEFARVGWHRVVAFQTRNPMHRAHYELTRRAARETDAHLLLHPAVGMTKPGDVDYYTRVRCYQALLHRFAPGSVTLALLPLAMRMAGPREALLHAIVRKNHGCSHFIVGRDHAGAGIDSSGKPFYGPYEAQNLLLAHQEEIGIQAVPLEEMVYVEEVDSFTGVSEVPVGMETKTISGTRLRGLLASGDELPSWFTFPEVAAELHRTHPPRRCQGLVIFLTGLSGAGKSTIASALEVKLLEDGSRQTSLLDGDPIRRILSTELTFSKEHRDLHVLRVAYVAAEIAKHGGIAICALIAPYERTREAARAMVGSNAAFILVHVATPLAVCEERDRKGLYAKARAGLVPAFTGISDAYEQPAHPELTIDTTSLTPDAALERILDYLRREGYLETTAAV